MSRTYKDSPNKKSSRSKGSRARQRNISVRAVRRDPPDLRKLSRALIALAVAQDEAEAAAGGPATDSAESPQSAKEPEDGR